MRSIAVSLLTLSLLSSVTPSLAQSPQAFVGLRYKVISEPDQPVLYQNFPSGVVSQGGWVIGYPFQGKSYTMGTYKQGNQQWFWFELTLSHQVKERPHGLANYMTRQVLDAIPAPSTVYGFPGCERNGKADPEIFGLISKSARQDSEWITQFHQVWRANRRTQKLEPLSPRGIRCPNPGWGV